MKNKSFDKFHKPDMIWIVFRSWLSWYGTTFGCRYRWLDEWIKSSQCRVSIHHHNKYQHILINIALLSVYTQIIITWYVFILLTADDLQNNYLMFFDVAYLLNIVLFFVRFERKKLNIDRCFILIQKVALAAVEVL